MWFFSHAFFRNEITNIHDIVLKMKAEAIVCSMDTIHSHPPLGSVSHLPLLGLLVDNLY